VSTANSSNRKPERILHISNTDIAIDSRILKELKVVSDLSNATVFAFGVPKGGCTGASSIDGVVYWRQARHRQGHKVTLHQGAMGRPGKTFLPSCRTVHYGRWVHGT
jgi:hypothetical protein